MFIFIRTRINEGNFLFSIFSPACCLGIINNTVVTSNRFKDGKVSELHIFACTNLLRSSTCSHSESF